MNHDLKCHPEPFAAARTGAKPYEIRVFDRPFAVGDTLTQREWDPATGSYSGRFLEQVVTYISAPGTWGLPSHIGVMGVRLLWAGVNPREVVRAA